MQDRCAPGDPRSGVAALRGAGFEPTRAAQQPGYFLCRIDGKPATDPCQRASPEDAYWSYWHAQPGGSWRYSGSGAADYDPAPGSIEGWAFGAGKPPSVAPPGRAPAPRSAEPTPSRTAPAGPSASPASTRAPLPTPAASSAVVAPPPSPGSPSPRSPSAAPPSAARTAAAAVSAPSSSSPVAAPVPDPPAGSGIGLGPVVALVLVAVLGVGAVLQARRRA